MAYSTESVFIDLTDVSLLLTAKTRLHPSFSSQWRNLHCPIDVLCEARSYRRDFLDQMDGQGKRRERPCQQKKKALMKCYCCRVTLTLCFNQLLACWPCKKSIDQATAASFCFKCSCRNKQRQNADSPIAIELIRSCVRQQSNESFPLRLLDAR